MTVWPKALFKYTPRKHAIDMVTHGEIRLGTLWEFRDTVRFRGNIGDAGEGKYEESVPFYCQSNGADFFGASKSMQRYVSNFVGNAHLCHGLGLINTKRVISSRDCFLFCATLRCSHRMLKEFGDTCVEISNPLDFAMEIKRSLQTALGYELIGAGGKCYYGRKSVFPDERHRPLEKYAFLVKPQDMSQDREFRFSFHPSTPITGVLTPQILKVPEIAKYCRLLTAEEHDIATQLPLYGSRSGNAVRETYKQFLNRRNREDKPRWKRR